MNGWAVPSGPTRRAVAAAVDFIGKNPGCTLRRVMGEAYRCSHATHRQIRTLFSVRKKSTANGLMWMIKADARGRDRITLLPGAEAAVPLIKEERKKRQMRWREGVLERRKKRISEARSHLRENEMRRGDLVVVSYRKTHRGVDGALGLYVNIDSWGYLKVLTVRGGHPELEWVSHLDLTKA